MRKLGFLLLAGGFLAAAYATALDARETDWMLFVPAAIVAAAGVLIVKRQSRGAARSAAVLTANRADLSESLDNVVAVLDELTNADAAAPVDLRRQIDDRLRNDLRRFADARESIVHLFGLQTYADIMSEFATGERYINRVWSASADGYDAEATEYLRRAAIQFRDARARLQAAT